ncbi:MAG: sugar phosphate isomerase/epimerase [Clostridia bacterium]|nr:sugar phosphate isomerase/epimerase [Clostridia bacterium]
MSEQIKYGLQLYSLRDITTEDLEGAIRGAAELGYYYMEFAGFKGHPAETVKGWLDKYGVVASSTHTELGLLTPENIQETIAYHKTIGCDYLIIPWMDCSTAEKLQENIDIMNYAQPILAEAGITLAFHNHSTEFIKTSYGVIPHEELQKKTSIEFQIDTFWAFSAGLDPVKVITELRDRVRMIHLKDGIPACHTEDNKTQGKSVGSGEAPVDAVRAAALDMGMKIIIESEGCDPTGLEEVGRCIAYLRSLEK